MLAQIKTLPEYRHFSYYTGNDLLDLKLAYKEHPAVLALIDAFNAAVRAAEDPLVPEATASGVSALSEYWKAKREQFTENGVDEGVVERIDDYIQALLAEC